MCFKQSNRCYCDQTRSLFLYCVMIYDPFPGKCSKWRPALTPVSTADVNSGERGQIVIPMKWLRGRSEGPEGRALCHMVPRSIALWFLFYFAHGARHSACLPLSLGPSALACVCRRHEQTAGVIVQSVAALVQWSQRWTAAPKHTLDSLSQVVSFI